MAQDDLYQPDQNEEQFLAKLQAASPYPITEEQLEDWRQYYRTELNPPVEEEPEGFTILFLTQMDVLLESITNIQTRCRTRFKLVRVEEL